MNLPLNVPFSLSMLPTKNWLPEVYKFKMLKFDTHHITQNRLRPITAIGHLSDTGDQFINIFLGSRLHNKNSYI